MGSVMLDPMARVVHFEIHAADPQRAIAFYEQALGWSFQSWEGPMPYWVVTTGSDDAPGINGGLMPRQGGDPEEGAAVNAYVCTAQVDDLDATVAACESAGGTLAVPKFDIPGVGQVAYVKDTEGNILGLMQPA